MSLEDSLVKNAEEAVTRSDGSLKRQKVAVPDGISKNAWKKIQKKQRWDEQKDEYRLKRRQKKIASKQRKAERKLQGIENDENYHSDAKKKLPQSQKPSGIKVIMDCEFDELMSDKEIVSLSNQITRCYAAKRHADFEVDLTISSFNKRLKERYEKSIQDYSRWKGIRFEENETLRDILPNSESGLSKCVYLTADTEEELVDLKEGHTYIIGGIVDKNRHKKLCFNKAKELGLQVGRLPIGKYIQMNGRHVLATSHVYELMCMWFESNQDWEKAFNLVLPPRKLKADINSTPANSSDGSEVVSEKVRANSPDKGENANIVDEGHESGQDET